MMTDGILASQLAGGVPGSTAGGASSESVQQFQQAYDRANAQLDGATQADQARAGPSSLLDPLLGLNSDSTRLAEQAQRVSQTELKPSELMMLTMRSHEFLFHCELVANVANRSSDGVQQLFRQQS